MKHARRHKREQGPPNKWLAYVGLPVVIVATLILSPRIYRLWYLPNNSWPSYPARVVATRVVRDGFWNSYWDSGLEYRVDVDAVWVDSGTRREAWVPTLKRSRDQAWLTLWASRQQKFCFVRQSPHNPSARIAFF